MDGARTLALLYSSATVKAAAKEDKNSPTLKAYALAGGRGALQIGAVVGLLHPLVAKKVFNSVSHVPPSMRNLFTPKVTPKGVLKAVAFGAGLGLLGRGIYDLAGIGLDKKGEDDAALLQEIKETAQIRSEQRTRANRLAWLLGGVAGAGLAGRNLWKSRADVGQLARGITHFRLNKELPGFIRDTIAEIPKAASEDTDRLRKAVKNLGRERLKSKEFGSQDALTVGGKAFAASGIGGGAAILGTVGYLALRERRARRSFLKAVKDEILGRAKAHAADVAAEKAFLNPTLVPARVIPMRLLEYVKKARAMRKPKAFRSRTDTGDRKKNLKYLAMVLDDIPMFLQTLKSQAAEIHPI